MCFVMNESCRTPRYSALYRRPNKFSVAALLVIAIVMALLAVALSRLM
jgi:hypothetical protein